MKRKNKDYKDYWKPNKLMMESGQKEQRKTILTNDPSLTGWGWAVVDLQGQVVDVGCIKTEPSSKKRKIRKGDDRVRRVSEINRVLLELIEKHNVILILCELPHGSQAYEAAVMLGVTSGMMQMLADSRSIGIEWYTEGDVKKYLFNRQSVQKQEMINKIDSLMNVPWFKAKYKNEGVADALGVYRTALSQSSALNMMKKL
jgi:Holliday junction resolvasome RuvABC endonuclease subunit